MRFQIRLFLSVFCLVLSGLLVLPVLESANAQLPTCTCDNSLESTCADGFRVTFEGQSGTTFTYSICNESDDMNSDCIPPMALSHADIIITNPSCIEDPGNDITTTIIGTDGSTTKACDAPTDEDKACGFENLGELLIKCDNLDTPDVFTPGPGQCIEIDIEVANTPGITVGPSIALNKAGSECGLGCLLGPSCEGCGSPGEGCCVESQGVCSLTEPSGCTVPPNVEYLGIGSTCTEEPRCEVTPPPTAIPTISEWGLIAMAAILGIVGFMVLRRRKVTA